MELLKHCFWPYSNSPVVRQAAPSDHTLAIQNEDGRASDIFAFHRIAALVAKVKTVDCDQLGVRKNRVVELQSVNQFGVFFNRIGADSENRGVCGADISDA